jgi:hypothetical protein
MLENFRHGLRFVTCTQSDSSDDVPRVGCHENVVIYLLDEGSELTTTGVLGIDRLQMV